jgi:hypothetical protein
MELDLALRHRAELAKLGDDDTELAKHDVRQRQPQASTQGLLWREKAGPRICGAPLRAAPRPESASVI